MHEKYAISDTHFFHENILKFKHDGHPLRQFDDIDDMHETIIRNWNAVVRPQDFIYHLGDVSFKYGSKFNELMSRLNGRKRLIVGNHDDVKQESLTKWFEKINLWKGFKEHDFTFTHIPARLEGLRDGHFNPHGHTHLGYLDDLHYINLCVEVRNYTPTHFDTIIAEIAEAKQRLA